MGFNSVYQSLTEIFPQIDSRLLRAVAMEHPLDADEAAAIVLSDIVPSFPSSSQSFTQSLDKSSEDSLSKREVERSLEDVVTRSRGFLVTPGSKSSASDSLSKQEVERSLEDAVSTSRGFLVTPGSKSSASSSLETTPLFVGRGHNTSASSSKLVKKRTKRKNVPLFADRHLYHKDVETGSKSNASFSSSETVPLAVRRGLNSNAWNAKWALISNELTNSPLNAGRGVYHKDVEAGSKSSASSSSGTVPLIVGRGHNTVAPITKWIPNWNELIKLPPRGEVQALRKEHGKELPKELGDYDHIGNCYDDLREATIGLHVPEDNLTSVVSAVPQDNIKFGSDFWQELDQMTLDHQESITSVGSENDVPKVVDLIPGDNMTSFQQHTSLEVGTGSTNIVDKTSEGSLASVNGVTELGTALISSTQGCSAGHLAENIEVGTGSTNVEDKTSNGSLASENGDTELGAALISSTQGCSVDHLEAIIEDAKSNKKTLLAVMDSVINLMKEVELQENDAGKSKVEAAWGGLETCGKVEELKKMLEHAKEANDMHAGEVYGEKSILATEVRELENRLSSLSEERNKSLSVLDEMRETLEVRRAAALEMKKAAEQEKKDKEDYALKALAEQEAVMEKVAQESKLLQQEAEENSKLREFLMDRGQIVDSLQGEISVICQDVKLLKEKFDNRVSLTKSISSSETSSHASFVRSVALLIPSEPFNEVSANPSEPFNEVLETSNSDEAPEETAMNEEEKKEFRKLIEDGWEWDMIN